MHYVLLPLTLYLPRKSVTVCHLLKIFVSITAFDRRCQNQCIYVIVN